MVLPGGREDTEHSVLVWYDDIFRVYLSSCKQKKKIVCRRIKTAVKRQMMMVNSSSLTAAMARAKDARSSQEEEELNELNLPSASNLGPQQSNWRGTWDTLQRWDIQQQIACGTFYLYHYLPLLLNFNVQPLKNNNNRESLAALARAQRNHLLHPKT